MADKNYSTPNPKITCGHPERRHQGRGLCPNCYYAWRRDNPDIIEADKERRKEKDPLIVEQQLLKRRAYNRQHQEEILENGRRWREANPEHVKDLNRQWREKNPEKAEEKTRRWREKNKQKVKQAQDEYNRTVRNERRRAIVNIVMIHYGGECACCGESHPKFLTIDHIENNGSEHRKEIGRTLYGWLLKNNFPAGFQVLCWNCNLGLARNGGICPHKEAQGGWEA